MRLILKEGFELEIKEVERSDGEMIYELWLKAPYISYNIQGRPDFCEELDPNTVINLTT